MTHDPKHADAGTLVLFVFTFTIGPLNVDPRPLNVGTRCEADFLYELIHALVCSPAQPQRHPSPRPTSAAAGTCSKTILSVLGADHAPLGWLAESRPGDRWGIKKINRF